VVGVGQAGHQGRLDAAAVRDHQGHGLIGQGSDGLGPDGAVSIARGDALVTT
jgi:hypothetical protein